MKCVSYIINNNTTIFATVSTLHRWDTNDTLLTLLRGTLMGHYTEG